MFENAKRIYREIRILRLLSHANVVRITHLQAPSDLLAFNDLYIVFECLGEWWSPVIMTMMIMAHVAFVVAVTRAALRELTPALVMMPLRARHDACRH